MLVAQSPISGHQQQLVLQSKSSRKPLQPKNHPSSSSSYSPFNKSKPQPNPAADLTEIESNKENVPPMIYSTPPKKESFQIDASLAEELSAIREKLERLRIDKDRTNKMLTERGRMLDLQMKEILDRGELQKHLEIEVDRLYRFKEIKLSCMRKSPLRPLRQKEQEKKIQQDQLKATSRTENKDEEQQKKNKESLLIADSEFTSKDRELKTIISSSPSL